MCDRNAYIADLPSPSNIPLWLETLRYIWEYGGCLQISTSIPKIPHDISSIVSKSRLHSGLAFSLSSLTSSILAFSLLPCNLGPRPVVLRQLLFVATTAIDNGVKDIEYLTHLPESVVCECLTGQRRLPQTTDIRAECIKFIDNWSTCEVLDFYSHDK